MKFLVLFDIDGTILNFRPGLAKELFAVFLAELFERDIPETAIPRFAGMTDLSIIRAIAENVGMEYGEVLQRLPVIWEKMLDTFSGHTNKETITLVPGARELILELAGDPDYSLALVTGNFRENAYLKLKAHRLDNYFETGAFGNDHENRNELPPIAIRRTNEFYKSERFFPYNTIVIGDTLRDIECARHSGIPVISVSSGACSVEELSSGKPDLLVSDLTDRVLIRSRLTEIFSRNNEKNNSSY